MQPRKLCEAQSADSFCAALRKPFWRCVSSWSLHQTHGESLLQERGEVCGVEGQGLGALWMEEGLLIRHKKKDFWLSQEEDTRDLGFNRPRPLEQVECLQGDQQQAVEGASRLAAGVRIGKDIFSKQMGNKKSDSKIGV